MFINKYLKGGRNQPQYPIFDFRRFSSFLAQQQFL